MSGPQRNTKNKRAQNDQRTATNLTKNKKKKGVKAEDISTKVENSKEQQIAIKMNDNIEELANQELWSELREHILYLYKIGRDQNLAPTTVDRVKYLVDTLCTKDIHQLFIRLELLATDVIKNWLESVERIFVNEVRNTTIAYNYLENVITDCESFLMSARKMLPMLRSLESHLRKFNMCWVLIHQNLFRVHYLEEKRCIARTKKAKLLLLSDVQVPVFTETILKFARFNEVFNTLSEEWFEASKKVQAFREPHLVYKHYNLYFKNQWQNFPSIKKKNKLNASKPTVLAMHSKQNVKKQNVLDNNDIISKTQAKKARRKAAADHSRQPSADLMPPPPPPRITDADFIRSESTSECDSNDRCQRKKSDASPQTPRRQLVINSKLLSSDNRDVDELVAFVEGLNLNEIEVDQVESENKKRRKKQKKEKQRLKKIQTLMEEEEEDQVAQLMKRSPGVTITMVRSDNPVENCHHSHQLFNSINLKPPVPNVPVVKPQQPPPPPQQPTPPATVNGSTLTYNPGSRMVTIRRITEANTDEPTVTITLKGPTPDQDQVLYRIINGQADYGHLADNILTKNSRRDDTDIPTETLTKKQRKKLKKQLENAQPIQYDPIPVLYSGNNLGNGYYDNDFIRITKVPEEQVPIIISANKKSKKQKKEQQKIAEMVLEQPSKNIVLNNQKSKKSANENSVKDNHNNNNMVKVTNNKPTKLQTAKAIKTQEYTSKPSQKQQSKSEKSKLQIPKQKSDKQTNNKQKTDLQKPKESTKRKQNESTKLTSYQPNEFLLENNNNNNYKLIPENLRLPAGITITKVTANVALPTSTQPIMANSANHLQNNNFLDHYHKFAKLQKFKGGADNVFAPKDIDLEDNTLDAAERELEAFKRFCQEPVPPQRQEATHLNVNKIIIKKNNQQQS